MKKTKKRFLRPLVLALALVFALPVFAFASSVDTGNADSLASGKSYFIQGTSTDQYLYVLSVTPNHLYLGTSGSNTTISSDVTVTYSRYYRSGSTGSFGSVYTNTASANSAFVFSNPIGIIYSNLPIYNSDKTTVYHASDVVVADTTAPVDVTNVSGTNVSDTGLTLNWSASVSTDVSAYQIYKGLELLGSTASTSFDVSGLTPSTAYDFTIKALDGSNNVSSGVTVHYSTVAAPVPPDQSGGGDIMTGLFPSLEAAGITTQATTWANNFDSLLLVVVGVGLGFAAVRFVKSLFF